jgi:hypothetical protein
MTSTSLLRANSPSGVVALIYISIYHIFKKMQYDENHILYIFLYKNTGDFLKRRQKIFIQKYTHIERVRSDACLYKKLYIYTKNIQIYTHIGRVRPEAFLYKFIQSLYKGIFV